MGTMKCSFISRTSSVWRHYRNIFKFNDFIFGGHQPNNNKNKIAANYKKSHKLQATPNEPKKSFEMALKPKFNAFTSTNSKGKQ